MFRSFEHKKTQSLYLEGINIELTQFLGLRNPTDFTTSREAARSSCEEARPNRRRGIHAKSGVQWNGLMVMAHSELVLT